MPILGGVLTPEDEFKSIVEMHNQGLPVNIEEATKRYYEAMKAAPHPGNGHASPAPAHNHALIPAKHKWYDHTLKSGMPGVVQAAMDRAFMPDKEELRRTLGVRLRARPGDVYPLDFIEFHVGKDKVYVFCVTPTGATIIEDGLDLFPSDALITAINLLKG